VRFFNKVRALFVHVIIASLVLVTAALPMNARAEEPQQDEVDTKSGYETVPGFGGPSSTPVALKRADRIKDTAIPAETWADLLSEKWYATKQRLNDEKGLAFGLHYNAVSQWDRGELTSDQGTGGIFELAGSWTMTGQSTPDSGSLVFLLEHQHRFNAGNPAEDFGVPSGSLLPTAQFGDYGWNLANLYWNGKRRNGKLVFAAGIVNTGDYVDYFALNDPLTAYQNAAFSGTPSIALPDPGLGAMLRVGADDLYVSAGFADANATAGSFDYSGIFDEGEYFTHLEFGWTPAYARRFVNNIHVSAWHVDKRDKAQVPEDWGVAFSLSTEVGESLQPFFRAGYSQGTAATLERSISTGVGIQRGDFNLLGLGLNWGQPPGDLADQYSAEVFYRFQLFPNFTLTPDLQLVIDPALDPDQERLLVFGLRVRVTF
jgi:porin